MWRAINWVGSPSTAASTPSFDLCRPIFTAPPAPIFAGYAAGCRFQAARWNFCGTDEGFFAGSEPLTLSLASSAFSSAPSSKANEFQ